MNNTVKLAPRQREIVDKLLQGKRHKEIAFELGISYNSVKVYVFRIAKKLGVSGCLQIVVWAYESGYRKVENKDG